MEKNLQYGAWNKLIEDVLSEMCAIFEGLFIPMVEEVLNHLPN